jgi:glutaredoxin
MNTSPTVVVSEANALRKVVLYTKDGCHLCERVLAELMRLKDERMFEISIKDITTDSQLFDKYKNIIPVIEVDGKVTLAGTALANPNTSANALRRTVLS